ncbi:MAG: hypothetical protein JWO38_5061 [Gemmataceae bacterium]|nr:hypothetical protein [Gemmataceae bacterium]
MRVFAIVLVVLGAIALGVQSFGSLFPGRAGGRSNTEVIRAEDDASVWMPPVVGGIVVVSGLLLLVTDTRRD